MLLFSKKFIFIGGIHKSGTTMLYDLISCANNVTSFQDTGVPENEGQYLQHQIKSDMYFGELLFGFSNDAYLNEFDFYKDREIANRMFHEWSIYWDLNKEYLLEKSPINIVRTRFINKAFPNSTIIIMIRDPRIVFIASKKNMPNISVDVFFKHWIIVYEKLFEDMKHIENIHLIQYEKLVKQKLMALKHIDSLKNIYFSVQEHFIEKIDYKYMKKWDDYILNNHDVTENIYFPTWCKNFDYEKGPFERL